MISVKELEEKRNYLLALRAYTEEEQEFLRTEFIIGNTKTLETVKNAYTREQKLLCLNEEWSEKEAIKINSILSFFWEIDGVARAYDYIQGVLKEEATGHYEWHLSENILKAVNRMLLDRYYYLSPLEKGFYRRGESISLGKHALPEPYIFEPRLHDLLDWYENTDHDLISKISTFHLKFEVDIHPFYDGNGRTGRSVLNLELARHGFPLINLKYNNYEQYDLAFKDYRYNEKSTSMQELISEELNRELDNQILIKEKN